MTTPAPTLSSTSEAAAAAVPAISVLDSPASEGSAPIEADAVIIGAGPVGLFQVFELGLLEIKAHVLDSLPDPGGQCVALYPDKPIYDIPAVPVVSGQGLTDNLLAQIKPFSPTFHLGEEVQGLQREPDNRFRIRTAKGSEFLAKTVFIAGGMGSFQARELKLDGLDRFNERQVFHSVRDIRQFEGKHVVVTGGGDSALDWSLAFLGRAASVTLVHRRDSFRAAPATVAGMRAACDAGKMRLLIGQITAYQALAEPGSPDPTSSSRLEAIEVTGIDGAKHGIPTDRLLVLFGLAPSLGPIAEWGLDLERRQLRVDTEKFETSEPGIFAVGDINTYPGKKKLILSGFHEAALAAFGAAGYVFPQKKIHLQYTTTSTKLHAVLGVESPTFD